MWVFVWKTSCTASAANSGMFFLLPPIPDYPECLCFLAAWRSAEFAFILKEREGEKRNEDKAEIMCVRARVRVREGEFSSHMFMRRKKTEGRKNKKPPKNPDLLTKHFLQGGNNNNNTTQNSQDRKVTPHDDFH